MRGETDLFSPRLSQAAGEGVRAGESIDHDIEMEYLAHAAQAALLARRAGAGAVNRFVLVPLLFPEPQDRVTVPYTFFKQQVIAGNVTEITSRGETSRAAFKQAVADPNPRAGGGPGCAGLYTKFATINPASTTTELLPLLETTRCA